MCSQFIQTFLNVLIATVDLSDVGNAACTLGAHCCNEEGDTCADIRARHASGTELDLTVVSYDNGTMRIAKDDLGTHVNQLIDKEQTTLKHFLMEKNTSLCLSGNHKQNGEQVGQPMS